ncbi:13455_t:CDS:2, partial [Racocetra persica]
MLDNDSEIISTKQLADKFEIGRSTVANILAKSSYWLGLDEEKKAKQIATNLKIQNFAVSDGWLQGFKKRHHIVYTAHCGKAASAPIENHYRKLLLQNQIAAFDESNLTNQPPDPVTIYDAIQFVAQAWNKVSEDVIIHSWQKTGILPSIEIDETIDSESLNDFTNEKEIELENLIARFQISKNPENPENLNISVHEFIEIDDKYATSEMPTVEDLIAEIQENESEEEPEQQIKPVTAIQAITGLDSVLGYIEKPESSLKIDIKVFSELKRIRKELSYQ